MPSPARNAFLVPPGIAFASPMSADVVPVSLHAHCAVAHRDGLPCSDGCSLHPSSPCCPLPVIVPQSLISCLAHRPPLSGPAPQTITLLPCPPDTSHRGGLFVPQLAGTWRLSLIPEAPCELLSPSTLPRSPSPASRNPFEVLAGHCNLWEGIAITEVRLTPKFVQSILPVLFLTGFLRPWQRQGVNAGPQTLLTQGDSRGAQPLPWDPQPCSSVTAWPLSLHSLPGPCTVPSLSCHRAQCPRVPAWTLPVAGTSLEMLIIYYH